jgi:hypothetical protein
MENQPLFGSVNSSCEIRQPMTYCEFSKSIHPVESLDGVCIQPMQLLVLTGFGWPFVRAIACASGRQVMIPFSYSLWPFSHNQDQVNWHSRFGRHAIMSTIRTSINATYPSWKERPSKSGGESTVIRQWLAIFSPRYSFVSLLYWGVYQLYHQIPKY